MTGVRKTEQKYSHCSADHRLLFLMKHMRPLQWGSLKSLTLHSNFTSVTHALLTTLSSLFHGGVSLFEYYNANEAFFAEPQRGDG